jgi:hypothetical protein
MKILFDQGTPAPLRHTLAGHAVSTAYEMGWARLENGDLLDVAESSFDAFVTTDPNLRHQQNLGAAKRRKRCRVGLATALHDALPPFMTCWSFQDSLRR